jgi:glutathione synthase/RimK-type ligase-like ATP-grasp enzyme
LRFGAIDMIVTPEGRYVFLEINPNGQWRWIEDASGLPISDALCDALARPSPPVHATPGSTAQVAQEMT